MASTQWSTVLKVTEECVPSLCTTSLLILWCATKESPKSLVEILVRDISKRCFHVTENNVLSPKSEWSFSCYDFAHTRIINVIPPFFCFTCDHRVQDRFSNIEFLTTLMLSTFRSRPFPKYRPFCHCISSSLKKNRHPALQQRQCRELNKK